jgi:glucan 1,3-beta-glucosidase
MIRLPSTWPSAPVTDVVRGHAREIPSRPPLSTSLPGEPHSRCNTSRLPADRHRTYLISSSIIDYFYTQLIGDPTNLPVIKASAGFPTSTTFGLIDGNQYGANGLAWTAINVFFRQVRNLVLDTTAIPAGSNAVGLHWPSSQATAVTNVVFKMSEAPGNKHVGLFIEEGSGGLLNDLVFYGGQYGARLGNQQYTSRNMTFYNADVAAINQLWDWGWTYKSLSVNNCPIGIDIADLVTGSTTLIDSVFNSVDVAINSKRNAPTTTPPAAGSLMMENVIFNKVNKVLVSPAGTVIPGNPSGTVKSSGFAMVSSLSTRDI